MRLKTFALCSTSIGMLALLTAPAVAQETPDTNLPESEADAAADAIVVTGLRRSLESAQTITRESDGIVDAVVAEDIGKLPDTFASSALQRVTGVQVTRGGGEAAGVQVRGLPDISTTYNGREIFTAEGRFVQIQDFPAGTVAALEVYKSGMANLIEGGIGGQVNVRGRKPFDFDGFELSGSANMVYWDQSDNFSPNGNLLVSDRWDTNIGEMGLLVNASYVGLDFLDATREQALFIARASEEVAPDAPEGFRYPDSMGRFYGSGERWRPSVNAAFQWKPTPDLEIYVDGLFQGFRSRDENSWLYVPIWGGGTQLTDVTFQEDNPDMAQSATVSGAFRPDGWWASVNAKTDTYQLGGGAIWKRDRLQVSGDIAYTDSTFTLTAMNIDHAFASAPTFTVNWDVPEGDGGPVFDFGEFDLLDPANYISRGLWQEYLAVGGKDVQARADVSYDVDGAFLKRFQAGVRYNDRDAFRDRGTLYIPNEGARIPIGDLPVELGTTNPGFDFDDAFRVRETLAIPAASIRDNMAALRDFYGAPEGWPGFIPEEGFDANEKALALYGQAKYGFELGDVMVDGLVGLRAVQTKTTISGTSRVVNADNSVSFVPVEASNEYWDYLPNVSARIQFMPELQMRLAYTKTRTRPSYFDLNPSVNLGPPPAPLPPEDPCYQNLDDPNCENSNRRGGRVGNPNLKPLTSDNYDLSLEWYFSRTGSLTASLFRRDATNFTAVIPVNSEDPVLGRLRLDTPVNLNEVRLQGAELAFTSFLDIDGIPEWAKGFGVQANATYIDGEGDLPPAQAATVNNEQRPFPGVSKWAANFILMYEKPVFSARLAYNYRSKYVREYTLEGNDPTVHGVIERGRGQLDFSTSVTPIENVTIAFDVVNILGNPLRRYRQFNEEGDIFPRQVLYLERTYSLGVRFRF